MPETPEKFYLTTPIYYVNARPHIGHAYTTIVADVLARRARAQGSDTWFLTGTDEHGQKIERSAAAAGIPPQQFADQISAQFQTLWDRMGLTYDQFIRTTDEAHKRGVQKLFTTLQENGHIYLDSYTGAYCVSDETFVDVPTGAPCPDCGRPTETVTEENYFFRLSNFQLPLLNLIESKTLQIEPDSRRNEVLSFLRGDPDKVLFGPREIIDYEESPGRLAKSEKAVQEGRLGLTDAKKEFVPGTLKDLSISRSSFTWGIPVPDHLPLTTYHLPLTSHVIYVWLDALANYLTAVGYGSEDPADIAKFQKYWPADLHIVGKEIIRFHCVYWPAFLLALRPADVPETEWNARWLPKKIVAHGWLLFDDSKMSKSKGNIVRTETILEAFGTLCPPPFTPHHTPNLLSSRSEAEGSASALGTPTPHDRDLFAADVLRYFLLREIPFGQDGGFSFEALITRYNADLANGYGNLVSRVLVLITQNLQRDWTIEPIRPFICIPAGKAFVLPERAVMNVEDAFTGTEDVIRVVLGTIEVADDFYRTAQFNLARVALAVSIVDKYISSQKPWLLAKSVGVQDEKKLNEVLYTAAESIRIITALLHPILPYATANVWHQLGLGDIEQAARNGNLKNLQWGGLQPGTRLGPLAPIFPRIEKKDIPTFIQRMTDMESPTTPLAAITTQHDASTPAHSDLPTTSLASEVVTAPIENHPTFDPAAAPRTSTLPETNPGAHVAASAALTTERPDPTKNLGDPKSLGAPSQAVSSPEVGSTAADASPQTNNQITIEDFAKIELRVAQIILAERIPKADKLLRLEVDLGYERRQILSGIAEWYTPEDLLGRRIVVITNLAPRKMRGLESHGMLLAASTEGGKPHLATIDSPDLPLGSRLK